MIYNIRKYTVSILLGILVLFFCTTVQGFASWSNFFNLLRQMAVLGIVSSGMAIVIITGNIDLSVGSVISLSSCIIAVLAAEKGLSPLAACVIGLAMCIVLMLLNGIIIVFTGMPAMLCTLAMNYIYQGIAYIITNAVPVYGLPESMRMPGQGYLGFAPIPVIIMSIAFVVTGLLLKKTYIGRYFYAAGSNEEASNLSGVPVKRIKLLAYLLCGALVGVAAIVQTSRLFGGFPTAGSGLEMDVIIAVVVGGVSFSGGQGSIWGVVQGVLLMGVLTNGLGVMGANTYTQLVFSGIVLVVVVGLDYLNGIKKRDR